MRGIFQAMILSLLAMPVFAGTPLPDGPHVVVPGEGTVNVAPDGVVLRLSVQADHAEPAAAKRQVDDAVNGYLAVLERHRVPSEGVTASSLQLAEHIDHDDNGRRIARGYRASRDVTARLQGVDDFNAVIDAALAAGMTRIEEIRFVSSRADQLRVQARQRAAEASRQRGEELAQAYGARLGRIYSINSLNSGLTPGYGGLDRVEVAGSRMPARYLQPSIEFNERVQVVFELIP